MFGKTFKALTNERYEENKKYFFINEK